MLRSQLKELERDELESLVDIDSQPIMVWLIQVLKGCKEDCLERRMTAVTDLQELGRIQGAVAIINEILSMSDLAKERIKREKKWV